MKTRSEKEILDLLLGFAEKNERIRAVIMNGSRVNPAVPADPFRDFDIVMIVSEVSPFENENFILPIFGEIAASEQPNSGPWPPFDADGSYYTYNMQLADGNRIDLSFYHTKRLPELLKDSLTRVLLDKDGLCPQLPPPNDSGYHLSKPDTDTYKGCCEAFFFALGSHIPKTIWRKNLPLLKFYIESWLREPLTMMLGWEIGIKTGFDKSIGK